MRIPIYIEDRIYIPRAAEFSDLLDDIRVKFNYTNPEFIKRKAMGFWTGNVHRRIETWEHVSHRDFGECLSIPRGGMKKVRESFNNYDVAPLLVDKRLSLPPINHMYNNVTLRPDQETLARAMIKTQNCLIRSPTGSGKCLHPNTKILMFDGTIKLASGVLPGDQLMGPDSICRNVLSTTVGYGPLYKIIPKKGDHWICNGDHVLTLIHTTTKNIIDIPLHEYLKKSKTFKHCHKLFMTGVNFTNSHKSSPLVSPYFLGIWLGDGRKKLSFIEITKDESAIKSAMEDEARNWDCEVKSYNPPDRCIQHRITSLEPENILLLELRSLMRNGIRIPHEYKTASYKDRMELLAGLIDTDGYYASGYYEIVQKRQGLANDIRFIAHSLGFRTTIKEKTVNNTIYYRVNILGDISTIPIRIERKQASPRKMNKDVKYVGFDIEYTGNGDYVGWTLDGDGRFLLGDFTVTHNTETALKVAEYILHNAGPVLIVVWETELMDQWIERISKRFDIPISEIGTLGGGRKNKIKPITVGMQQTIKNKVYTYTPLFGGIICDEIQRFAATTYQKVELFPAKYRIGISADETRSDKKEFLIYDMFGEIAEEIKRSTLIERGDLHDVIIRLIPTDFDYALDIEGEELTWHELEPKNKDFNDLLDILCYDEERNDLIWKFIYPTLLSKQTMMIITHRVDHAIYWNDRINSMNFKSGLMLGGPKYKDEFKRTKEGLLNGRIQIGVGTIKKIGQALDIPPWNRGFVITPTSQNKQQFEQILGRLRRTSTNKTEAVCYYLWDRMLYPRQRQSLAKRYPNVFIWDDEGFLPTS